ncbi:hypothetical protein BDV96DRAFT_327320 [Lophiotrema nucula]|uniref:Uncharacterized protein n=1 Tax=Lophiotrema nucula TaxID=690887 RepID=A0A6A5YIC5_9PLEO|nr:hypothetical protein BDV96DRAFT_327320 [Lophiotrema nucula]
MDRKYIRADASHGSKFVYAITTDAPNGHVNANLKPKKNTSSRDYILVPYPVHHNFAPTLPSTTRKATVFSTTKSLNMCYSKLFEDLPGFIAQWQNRDCPPRTNRCSCKVPSHLLHINVRRILDYSVQRSRRYEDFQTDMELDLQGRRRPQAIYDDTAFVDTELISLSLLKQSDSHPSIVITAPTAEKAFIGMESWTALDYPHPGPKLEVYVGCHKRTKKAHTVKDCQCDKCRREISEGKTTTEAEGSVTPTTVRSYEGSHDTLSYRHALEDDRTSSDEVLKVPARDDLDAITKLPSDGDILHREPQFLVNDVQKEHHVDFFVSSRTQ